GDAHRSVSTGRRCHRSQHAASDGGGARGYPHALRKKGAEARTTRSGRAARCKDKAPEHCRLRLQAPFKTRKSCYSGSCTEVVSTVRYLSAQINSERCSPARCAVDSR